MLNRNRGIVILLAFYLALLPNITACLSNPVDIDHEKSEFLRIINEYRQNNGIGTLKISSALTTAAQLHSEDMAAHNYFNHTSLDGRTFVDRIRAAGYNYNTWLGENIAAGFYTAESVFGLPGHPGWKDSPGHNANMLNPNYVVIGIGIAENDASDYKIYWTTDFGGYDDGTPQPPPPPPNNPPNVPSTPSGPTTGYSGASYSFSTSTTDPDGDQVKYTFDWNDGTTSATGLQPSGSTGSLSHTWNRQGEYHVWVKATDSKGASSDWSSPLTITIKNRSPNTPNIPSGPATGYTSTSYTFTTSATDPDGNQLKYTFNWTGSYTTTGFFASGSTASASHTWSQPGTYSINVMATDSDGANSSWSSPVTINIENAPPNTPARPSGTTSCTPNSSYEYSVYASDPDDENVHCVFDWGDGATMVTPAQSSGSLFKASHTWGRLGTFSVKVKAIDSAGKESPWSQPTTVEVKLPSTITIATSLSAVARGEKLAVNGSINPPHASVVTLTYRKPDGSQIIVQVKSDQNGNYNDVIAPNAVGTWSVQASWNGDDNHFGSSTSPITFGVDPALCSVTFESNATGISALVDGLNYSLPQSFKWLEGTAHAVIVEESHYFAEGGRYVFRRWDDGLLDLSRNIIVKDPATYQAIFTTQYIASIKTEPNSSESERWYDEGIVIQLSVNSTVIPQGDGSRLVFKGWSNNASEPTINLTVHGPTAVEALWMRQFLLQVSSTYGHAEGGGWHDESSEVNFWLLPIVVDCGNGTRRVFHLWVGEGAGGYSGEEPNNTLTIIGPVNETATWGTQYYVAINSTHGQPLGAGWHDEFTATNVSVESVVYDSETSRFTFQRWKGLVDGQETNVTIMVDSPISIEAVWRREFYLNLTSQYGETWGAGWYAEGSNASFGVISPPPNIVGYAFDGWTGDETAKTLNATALMDRPKSMIAKWHRDYTEVGVLSALGLIGIASIILYRRRHGKAVKGVKEGAVGKTSLDQKSIIIINCHVIDKSY